MSAALGVVASTVSIALVWPQLWLSCRHRRTVGMSPTGTWLAVALNVCWLVFGILTGDLAQIVTNAVVGAANTALLGALLLTQPALRARAALLRTASGAVCLMAFAAGSAAVVVVLGADPAVLAGPLGATASLVGAAACLPQPLSLLRDRTQDVSGLSPSRWVLGAGSSAAWTAYGLALGQPAVWLSAAVGLVCALVVCGVVLGPRVPGAPVLALGSRPPRAADPRPVLAAA
ncbi:SemiSWEET transporter [Blastococcus atacamensis]|uniref:SemiSWEET transporter n=1 Tax=Blastococcus atacamensis TaxID=2070508 RepID=UPI000CEC0B2E|nr:SemiSWEET transporter [Blastococcus atacamensis]